MSAPRVSVVTIFLDTEKRFLDEAVESVFAQTFDDWELLLVDDGSTRNGASETARAWAERHPGKVRVLEHPGHQNRGMSAARNLGVAEARGELVAFVDSDDVWRPPKLEEQVEVMDAHPGLVMVYGKTELWSSWSDANRRRDTTPAHGIEGGVVVEPPRLLTLLLRGRATMPTTCSFLMPRSAIAAVGGFEESFRTLYEDQVMIAKMCLEGPIWVDDRCWDRYRQHPASACNSAGRDLRLSSQAAFLDWLEGWLDRRGVGEPDVRRALAFERFRVRHPRLGREVKRWRSLRRLLRPRARISRHAL